MAPICLQDLRKYILSSGLDQQQSSQLSGHLISKVLHLYGSSDQATQTYTALTNLNHVPPMSTLSQSPQGCGYVLCSGPADK